MLSQDDKDFLEKFMSDELTEDGLKQLDEKMKDDAFSAYYEQIIKEKYNKPMGKMLIDYLPMIIMIGLIVLGGYLFIKSNF